MKHLSAFLIVLFLLLNVSNAQFKYENPVWVKNNTATALTNVQVLIKFNTQVPIAAGWMLANGNDIRFVSTCNSSTYLGHWVEGYLNTDTTAIWVNVPSIGASDSTQIFLYYGNPAATNLSTLAVFYGPHSSTDSVIIATAGGVANSQRGFRFTANEDVLIGYFGKREPTGTQRYVTLFDFTTQAVLAQIQVTGAAAVWNYGALTTPLWLKSGQQYIIELFQGAGDGYYFGTSSQIGQHLTYGDMRYCNTCTQNTFPTSILTNYHYGTPDFLYYTKQNVSPAPTYRTLPAADTVTPAAPVNLTATPGSGSALLKWNKNLEFDMFQYGCYRNTTNNPSTSTFIGPVNHPDTTLNATGLTNGTTYYFWVRAADRYCVNRVSGYSLVASCTPGGGTTYAVPELMYYKFENNPSATTTPNTASAPVGTNNPSPIVGHVLGSGGMVDTAVIGTTGAGANGITPGWNWNVTGNWTIGMWVSNLAETSPGSPCYLFGDAGSGSFRCFYAGAALPNNIIFRGPFSATGWTVNVPMPGSYYIHLVWNGTAIVIYKNGVLVSTNPCTNVMPTGTGFRFAGYGTTNYSLNAGGKMDEFRLYNRALTQAEITATWNTELPVTVSTVEPVVNVPDKFYLSQNYPNPFNPTTTIKFGLKKDALVEMKVFDVTGREVVTLINAQYRAGSHSIEFNGANLSSGVYFYRLTAGEFREIKKMVLIK